MFNLYMNSDNEIIRIESVERAFADEYEDFDNVLSAEARRVAWGKDYWDAEKRKKKRNV